MLELTTKRPTMQLMIDGSMIDVPLTFTARELSDMNKSDDQNEAMFSFFGKYVPGFDELGDDALSVMLAEWTRLREELGEPSLGE